MQAAWRLRILAVEAFERPVPLRLPFRFGVVTLRRVVQAFVRVRVGDARGAEGIGWAAELMVPKWFDKRPELSDADNVRQLRASVATALRAHLELEGSDTAFGLARAARERAGVERAGNGLVAGFGPALVERAVVDAACRLAGQPFASALRGGRLGIDFRAELPELDADALLRELRAAPSIRARHTVGLADALTRSELDPEQRLDDGLPECVEEAIDAYGHRDFKVKVAGDRDADLARLGALARVLEPLPRYRLTLDGNEQFPDEAAAGAFLEALWSEPSLERLRSAVLYVEQPIHRDRALDCDVRALARFAPLIVDESDARDGSFEAARERGYAGISSKTCKGIYRSLLNRARCQLWNRDPAGPRSFVSAEDLTCQAGLSVQQDLLLAALLGCEHAERNGHHYADGMVGASAAEMDGFAAAHPDLYRRSDRGLHLRIRAGRIALGSLDAPGFASAALPDPGTLTPMEFDLD